MTAKGLAAGGWTRREVLAGLGAGTALVALGGLAACSSDGGDDRRTAPTDGSPGSPFTAPDEVASSGGRLDVTLVAEAAMVAYGESTRWALTYNGTVPGPTLRVRPGDLLTITLENRLDAPTNLHTHGLHVSPEGDADDVFAMVMPGERRTYRYPIPADHRSGTFWYHPHHHGDVAGQLFAGLAGTILVEDAIDRLPELAAATSRVLVLSDPDITRGPSSLDPSMMGLMLGREGDTILLNGRRNPTIAAVTGGLEHWRIVNASPSRHYALRLDGQQFRLIAVDGGRLAAPRPIDELVLVPGERAEVLVAVTTAGTHELTTRTVDRGGMGMMGGGQGGGMGPGGGMGGTGADTGPTVVATVAAEGPHRAAAPLPATLTEMEDLADAPVDRTRTVTLEATMGMGGAGGRFTIDGRSFDADRTDITAALGTTEDWTITNTSPMDHPFHLHVWPFQVVTPGGAPAAGPAWKDTVAVPAGGSVRIRIPFRDLTGRTVYHCHILDHEDLGMMGTIDVRRP